MNITIVGTGYVGLVAGTCFAEMGNEVHCIDTNKEQIEKLKKGIMSIYEPELQSLVIKNYNEGRLHFATNITESAHAADFIFIAVNTPPHEDGSADLKHVIAVAQEIGKCLNKHTIIVNKSTVPVGTGNIVRKTIQQELDKRGVKTTFDIVSNPEFLKEGDAVNDFMRPERVIVGSDSEYARGMMEKLYSSFFRKTQRIINMDIRSAEVTKYAANSMLATKISFMNEMSNLCELVDADIEKVRLGIGSDSRIGYSFIYPGIGYGGSCFPKDIKAIIKTASEHNYSMDILKAVENVNAAQKQILFHKIKQFYDLNNIDLKGRKIAIWGLSFKPETDDIREAPSIEIINKLLAEGAIIQTHDPQAIEPMKKVFSHTIGINYYSNPESCLEDADILVILTEWRIYRQPNFSLIKTKLKLSAIFDGRNMYEPEYINKYGLQYYSIGRKAYNLTKVEQ